ncbi:MAG TPA: energy-coupling factor transporter transmembrane component T [Candidatus Polarisedimenticolia bacterium]|nr:energy-coupling factor transporter transmembrane component T [Candidatus Polarisedimenticolia bacterium]
MTGAGGLYAPSGSFLHRLNPSGKVVALGLWFTAVLAASSLGGLAALAAIPLGAAAAAGLTGVVRRFGRFAAVLFVVSVALWGLLSRDEAGMAKGAVVGARLAIMLVLGLLFLASTRVEEMTEGLRRLGVPYTAAFALTLSFRLLPVFLSAAGAITEAQEARGLQLRGGPLHTRLGRYVPLLVPLVLAGLRSATTLAPALESRGLGMKPGRTSLLESRWRGADGLSCAFALAAAAAALWS